MNVVSANDDEGERVSRRAKARPSRLEDRKGGSACRVNNEITLINQIRLGENATHESEPSVRDAILGDIQKVKHRSFEYICRPSQILNDETIVSRK